MRIVIIGATAAGTSAAIRCRELYPQAEIVLLEKESDFGLARCSLNYYLANQLKSDVSLTRGVEEFVKRYRVEIKLNTPALEIIPRRKTVVIPNDQHVSYDHLIIATGSKPIRPAWFRDRIAGLYCLHSLTDAQRIVSHMRQDTVKQAIIIGAGTIGIGAAYALRRNGYHVTLVEQQDRVAPFFDPEFSRMIADKLSGNHITIMPNTVIDGLLTDGEHLLELKSADRSLPVSLCLVTAGFKPHTELASVAGLNLCPVNAIIVDDYLRTSEPGIFAAGDCCTKRSFVTGNLILEFKGDRAVREGRFAAENLEKPVSRVSGTLQSLCLATDDFMAATIGLTETEAVSKRFTVNCLYQSGTSAAGYMPGAERIMMKLISEKPGGRILGCQLFGNHGIDKRLAVIASLMRQKAGTSALVDLDLGYTPTSVPVQDILHTVGQIADNLDRRLLKLITPREFITRIKSGSVSVCLLETIPEPVASFIRVYAKSVHEIPATEFHLRYEELGKRNSIVLLDRGGRLAFSAGCILDQHHVPDHCQVSGGADMLAYFI